MKNWILFLVLILLALPLMGCTIGQATSAVTEDAAQIALPEPAKDSDTSIEQALWGRRSTRSFSNEAMTLEQLSQLLWAGQGITDPSGKRTAPSAMALYPLKLYVVVGNVEGIKAGIYLYDPDTHTLNRVIDGDKRSALAQAAMGQPSVSQGAVAFIISANYSIMTKSFSDRGIRFADLEAGHAAQNICLQAVGLHLGTVTVGSFTDSEVQKVLGLPSGETPLYIIPTGNFTD
jgi:SagB-type dehydrogenase family enzyme